MIASLQQELGGTVEPLRPPHALVAGLPHLASSQSPWECSGYSSRVVVERLGSGKRDGGAKITSASPKLKKLSFTQRGYGVYF
ncbi:MAG: hypothetical protein BRC57_01375 [Cyanobacteria bacterium QS_8_48_54]|nr:MAG: hypothetical protein BRC57_01375 [Cyanobacteria bacterium QS_8_48_54]